jgi:hypothetical protein
MRCVPSVNVRWTTAERYANMTTIINIAFRTAHSGPGKSEPLGVY